MGKLIPVLGDGMEPPQGLSYKRLEDRYCLFIRVKTQMVRIEVSKKFPWIGIKAHDLAAPK